MENNRIVIPLGNGYRLIAERNVGDYGREIYIGIADENDRWLQDLALVRNAYTYDGNTVVWDDRKFEVAVWSNPESEDYTDHFEIPLNPEA